MFELTVYPDADHDFVRAEPLQREGLCGRLDAYGGRAQDVLGELGFARTFFVGLYFTADRLNYAVRFEFLDALAAVAEDPAVNLLIVSPSSGGG